MVRLKGRWRSPRQFGCLGWKLAPEHVKDPIADLEKTMRGNSSGGRAGEDVSKRVAETKKRY